MRPLLTAAIMVVLSSSVAQAGFEWHPPSEKPASIPAPQQVTQAPVMAAPYASVPAPAPVGTDNTMPRVPAQPVMAAPLSPMAPPPEPSAPDSYSMAPQAAPMQARPLNSGGLYINPYPLGEGGVANPANELTSQSVEQVMAEKGGVVHPVQLGAGMTSGARPSRLLTTAASEPAGYNSIPRPPMRPSDSSGMTPMVGGEPAPLPGMENMAQQTVQSRPTYFAQATGFGEDIPLELALSQIIPGEFNHTLSPSVDSGMMVSWKGGKAWNKALNDMLRPKGLTAVIDGRQVIIQPGAQS